MVKEKVARWRRKRRRRASGLPAGPQELGVEAQWNAAVLAVSIALTVLGVTLITGDFEVSPWTAVVYVALGVVMSLGSTLEARALKERAREVDDEADGRQVMAREELERVVNALWRSGERQDESLRELRQIRLAVPAQDAWRPRGRDGRRGFHARVGRCIGKP